jgi:hypothetical protein
VFRSLRALGSRPGPFSHRRDAQPCCCAPEPLGRIFPGKRCTRFGAGHFVHRGLPGALGDLRVGRRQIRPRNLEIENWLAVGFVLGMQEREGLGFVSGAQADLLAGGRILAVINARSAKH